MRNNVVCLSLTCNSVIYLRIFFIHHSQLTVVSLVVVLRLCLPREAKIKSEAGTCMQIFRVIYALMND